MMSLGLVLSVVPALAQAPGGSFKATLDGKPITCQIWPMQSDFLSVGNSRTVGIHANRCDGMASQITLGFEQTGESIDSVEIRIVGAGGTPDLYGGSGTGATLKLLSASENGDVLTLSGDVSAKVGTSENRGRTIDLSAVRELQINFSGVIEGLVQ